MKRLPKGLHVYNVPLYGGTVLMTCDQKKFRDAARFFGCEPEDKPMGGRAIWSHHDNGTQAYTIGVFDKKVSTLVHECGHISLFICEHVGIDPKASSGEPFCYLLDSMVERFLPHLKK